MLELIEIEEEDGAMPPDKALFGSRETSPISSEINDVHAKKYMGQERRRVDRRQQTDRRDDVRFEMNSSDRRQKEGRRHNDAAPKFW
jgi:hypothetical protein